MGSGDIQSLADLGHSFEVVRTTRMALTTGQAIVQLVAATLAPLALTMMSLEDLLKTRLRTLF